MSQVDLARHVSPALTEARLERQYSAIARALPRPRTTGRMWVSIVAAVTVVGALLFLARRTTPSVTDSPRQLATLETGTESQALDLGDGSRVEAAANTRLILAEISNKSVRIGLDHGRVDCDVTHVSGREFVVVAGAYEVRVVGTRFSVTFAKDGVRVEVTRGAVEIRRSGDAPRRVLAGETWNAALTPAAPPTASREPLPPASATAPKTKPAPPETAKQLFDRAQRARAAGRVAEAREAFGALRSRYPNDPRASLAAFELARIELDGKGDAKQASKLLDSTIENAPPGSSLREDAEARRIDALERAGETSACNTAKRVFLARYPKSIHRARVLGACPKP